MSLEPLDRLSKLTGRGYRKIKELLANQPCTKQGNKLLYESRTALPLIYEIDQSDEESLTFERTRLARVQADKIELEISVLKGQLIKTDDLENQWLERAAKMRAALLALPGKLANVAVAAASLKDIEDAARAEIYSALAELATHGENTTGTRQETLAEPSAAAAADSQSVGGRKPRVKPRKQRATRQVAQR